MIDTNELSWGLRPFRKMDVLAAYGARTIFQRSEIEYLRVRQQFLGGDEQQSALCNWINNKAFPALKKHIRENFWDQETDEIFTLEDWPFVLEASPKCSYGYLYISAYLNGFDSFPKVNGDTVKWSGNFIPEPGETVLAVTNRIGLAKVLGFYVEHGWVGVILKPHDPPEWYVRQNGKDAICGLFGTEIRKIDTEAGNESR